MNKLEVELTDVFSRAKNSEELDQAFKEVIGLVSDVASQRRKGLSTDGETPPTIIIAPWDEGSKIAKTAGFEEVWSWGTLLSNFDTYVCEGIFHSDGHGVKFISYINEVLLKRERLPALIVDPHTTVPDALVIIYPRVFHHKEGYLKCRA